MIIIKKGYILAALNKTMLIAFCGINCGICSAYLRSKNKCQGCRIDDINKPVYCVKCKIRNCKVFKNEKAKFCFECDEFPCGRLKNLDKRYRTRYNTSMIENLGNIKSFGIRKFLINEKQRWTCSRCGSTICIHKGYCLNCEEKK